MAARLHVLDLLLLNDRACYHWHEVRLSSRRCRSGGRNGVNGEDGGKSGLVGGRESSVRGCAVYVGVLVM